MTNKKETASAVPLSENNLLDKMAGFLLQHANPSIVFHVKNDVLHSITEEEKKRSCMTGLCVRK